MPESPSKFDPSIQTEDIAFRDDELVSCPKCGRKNSPERVACLYCAAALGTRSSPGTKLKFRTPEPWEKGQNVVMLRATGDTEELASLLSLETADLETLVRAGVVFPVVRVASVAEAETIIASLPVTLFKSIVVSDQDLDAAHPPRRLAGLELNDDVIGLIDFNTRQVKQMPFSDIACVVTGTVISGKTDVVEKRKRGKPKNVLEESSTTSDEALIDIYTKQEQAGFRIHNSGFDFSCLGDDKSLLASENMRRLIAILRESIPSVRVRTSYDELAPLLSDIWPIEVLKDHRGLVRSGIGKREFGISEITSNAEQFTKFSRLQWYAL